MKKGWLKVERSAEWTNEDDAEEGGEMAYETKLKVIRRSGSESEYDIEFGTWRVFWWPMVLVFGFLALKEALWGTENLMAIFGVVFLVSLLCLRFSKPMLRLRFHKSYSERG